MTVLFTARVKVVPSRPQKAKKSLQLSVNFEQWILGISLS